MSCKTKKKVKESEVEKSSSYVYSNFKIRDSTTEAISIHNRNKKMKGRRSLKKLLTQAESKKSLIQQLKEQGSIDKAVDVSMRAKWKAAFDKSEGRKVRDDVSLIRKSIRKEAKAKAKSKKQWKERTEVLEQKMAKKQLKRVGNIKRKQHQRKEQKIAKLKKRGRIF